MTRFRIIKLRPGTPPAPDVRQDAAPAPRAAEELRRDDAPPSRLRRAPASRAPAVRRRGDARAAVRRRSALRRRLRRQRRRCGSRGQPTAAGLDSPTSQEAPKGGHVDGRHQHQPGRPHRQPHADPELRSLPSGTSVCKLRVACNTRRKDGPTGEWVDKPNYFDVTVWGAQGENCARYLTKGRPVAIDGRLEWREWESEDGGKRQAIDIIADAVQFLGGRDDAPAAAGGGGFAPRSDIPVDTSDYAAAAGGGGGGAPRGRRRHPVLETSRSGDLRGPGPGPPLRAAGQRTPPHGRRPASADLERRAAGHSVRSAPGRRAARRAPHALARFDPDADFAVAKQRRAKPTARGGATRRAAAAAAGASPARTARTRSSRSTTRTSSRCAGSSPSAARSARAASPAPAGATRARSPRRSSAPASWRCCPTPPSPPARTARAAAAIATGTAATATATVACLRSILLKDVENVGERGAVVDVSKGYLRNYLDPAQARPAGDEGRARGRPRARQEAAEHAAGADRRRRAQEPPSSSTSTVLTIEQQAGDDGRLFGSVTNQDIADAIKEARGITVDKRKVHLAGPDQERRHLPGRRRGRGRRHRDRQDDGRRAQVARAPLRNRRADVAATSRFASPPRRLAFGRAMSAVPSNGHGQAPSIGAGAAALDRGRAVRARRVLLSDGRSTRSSSRRACGPRTSTATAIA